MRKTVITSLFQCFTVLSFAQVGLGLTEYEIRNSLTSTDQITRYDDTDKVNVLLVTGTENNLFNRYYIIDAQLKVCYLYVVEPKTDEFEKVFTEALNKKHIVLDARNWRYYEKGSVVRITLEYKENLKRNVFKYQYGQ